MFLDRTFGVVYGDGDHNILVGTTASDLLIGMDGFDTLSGGAGADVLLGGGFDDTLDGGADADYMVGGNGIDIFLITQGSHHVAGEVIAGVFDALAFDSTTPGDTLVLQATIAGVIVFCIGDLGGVTGGPLFAGLVNLNLDASNLTYGTMIQGNNGSNLITGTNFNDTMEGGFGDDVMAGLGGDDRINELYGGTDTVILRGSLAEYTFADGGSSSVSVVDGVAGRDGTDLLTGIELLNFNGVGYALFNGDGNGNSIDGGADNDLILGFGDDDTIGAGGGNDVVIGGAGDDVLDAGAGSDRFRYDSIGDGLDQILNFDGDPTDGQDVLDLDALFDALGVATADRAARVQITDMDGGGDGPTWLIQVDTDGAGGVDLDVATIASADQITVNDDVQVGTL